MSAVWVRVTHAGCRRRSVDGVIAIDRLGLARGDDVRSAGLDASGDASPAAVRALFRLSPSGDRGYEVINEQREAILAPAWAAAMGWLPAVLARFDGVVADVESSTLGLVEESARRAGVPYRRGGLHLLSRWSRLMFLLGEVLSKALVAHAKSSNRDVDILFYAEVPNHWRHVEPVASELRARGHRVGFLQSAVQGLGPLVSEVSDDGVECSLDWLALRPGTLVALLKAAAGLPLPEVQAPTLSAGAVHGLRRRALYSRLVYEKARLVGRGLRCRVCVFGDASAHRPAGLSRGLAESGIPTVSMQHGAIADPVRYRQQTDVFMVWDQCSAEACASWSADCRVVGVPGLEAERSRQSEQPPGQADRALLAPTLGSAADLIAWVRDAAALSRRMRPDLRLFVRLHPRTPAHVCTAFLAAELATPVPRGEGVAESILASDLVISDGSSILTEARLFGREAVEMPRESVTRAKVLPEERVRTLPTVNGPAATDLLHGSIGRAADVIEAAMIGEVSGASRFEV